MQSRPLFELRRHSLSYAGKPVLESIDLRIEAGEKVALVGPSGAGKSSLLRLLQLQHNDQIALCPQQLALVQPLSLFHNIYMGRLGQHPWWYNLTNLVWPLHRPKIEIEQLATLLGLESKLGVSVDKLSGGQQQRAALGRALYQKRPVFFGDEPVSSLDEYQADQILTLLCQRHQTLVVALHDQQQALKHFDRLIALKQGRLVLDAPCSELDCDRLAAVYQ